MFTGIVETIGSITSHNWRDGCLQLSVQPNIAFDDLSIGDSVSVNGVCLTVTHFTDSQFDVSLVPETLRLTNLGDLKLHAKVNLERAMSLNQRIGGHMVQGHVDTKGTILDIQNDNSNALLVKISIPNNLSRYIVPKGFITLDGMSITVIDAMESWFSVTFIPHTQEVTITQSYKVGSIINIEVDMMGKYIERLLGAYQHASSH